MTVYVCIYQQARNCLCIIGEIPLKCRVVKAWYGYAVPDLVTLTDLHSQMVSGQLVASTEITLCFIGQQIIEPYLNYCLPR